MKRSILSLLSIAFVANPVFATDVYLEYPGPAKADVVITDNFTVCLHSMANLQSISISHPQKTFSPFHSKSGKLEIEIGSDNIFACHVADVVEQTFKIRLDSSQMAFPLTGTHQLSPLFGADYRVFLNREAVGTLRVGIAGLMSFEPISKNAKE